MEYPLSTRAKDKQRCCLVTRDIQDFDLLVEDLTHAIGQSWGHLPPNEAQHYLCSADAFDLDFVIIAVDEDDRDDLSTFQTIAELAGQLDRPVLLVGEDLTSEDVDLFLELGVQNFLEYPLEKGALENAISGLKRPNIFAMPEVTIDETAPAMPLAPVSGTTRNIFAVQGMCGGVGSTSMAVHLAQEFAMLNQGKTCLIDLDLLCGSIANHLDIQVKQSVEDLWKNGAHVTAPNFLNEVESYDGLLSVLPVPAAPIASDAIEPSAILNIINLAAAHFDHVVIDLPKGWRSWSAELMSMASKTFCTMELDERSCTAAQRFLKQARLAGVAPQQFGFVVNRVSGDGIEMPTDFANDIANALDLPVETVLPDAGPALGLTADLGFTLADGQPDNPYWLQIQQLACRHFVQPNSDSAAA